MGDGAREDVDLTNSRTTGFSAEWNPEKERLALAKWALGAIAVLAIGAVGVYVRQPEQQATKDVFETAKVVLPPIVTLILGAYFKTGRD